VTLDNGALAPVHKQKKHKVAENVAPNENKTLQVLQLGDARELQMPILHILLEFGSSEDKHKALILMLSCRKK
jgi:hypothetical protein